MRSIYSAPAKTAVVFAVSKDEGQMDGWIQQEDAQEERKFGSMAMREGHRLIRDRETDD